jgi:predicted nucleic acid-binding protein
VPGVVYDTGALLAAERGDPSLWALHRRTLRSTAVQPVVPVVVLAQAWRGGPQAQLSRLLRGCHVQPDTTVIGKAAGAACAVARSRDVVDAIVVVTAVALGDALVVTSDVSDLTRLADALRVRLDLFSV